MTVDLRSFDLLWSRYEAARGLAERTGAQLSAEQPIIDGRYRLEARIGVGNFGYVYRALDLRLRRAVAVKTVDPGATAEAIALAKLRHRNVVSVHDSGVVDGCGYLVMELLEGETLTEWRKSAPRDRRQIIDIYLAAGRGLAAAHLAGVVHRDFKPDNVMVCDDGRVVVLDFGIASSAGQLARDGRGTLGYMAPEQITGAPVTPASDQFSFCVALWEALVGSSPFFGGTVQARIGSIIAGPREPAPDGKLARALRRGLECSPDNRWPTMASLLGELARAERRRSRRRLTVGASIAAAAVVAWGLVPTTATVDAGKGQIAERDLTVRSLTLLAIAAAEDGRADDALNFLGVAEYRSRDVEEKLSVARAADEVGLELYVRREWMASVEAHGQADRLYRSAGEGHLAVRSLELARTAEDARRRSL